MRDDLDNDDLLERLRAEDPAADTDAEAPQEREAIRSRVRELLESDTRDPKGRLLRPRLVLAGAVVLVAALAVSLGLALGGSSSGPATALAIERTPKWVTLKLTDPTASDDEMNQELVDAGLERVRVLSVPGDRKSVGTWAGYVELGPHCLGGVTRFGYDVDIPISHPYNRANRHGAEDLFDLTLPRRSGSLTAQEVGDPYSKSVVRLPTDSVDNPRNAAKVLVPVRPRNPDDSAATNNIGADQLIALGGVFSQYGEAVQSGQTSCEDFGLTSYSDAPFPPSDQGWVVIDVTAGRGGGRKMTRELRAGGINGVVRQIPAQRRYAGRYMSLVRVPPLPKHSPPFGTGNPAATDVVFNSHAHGPAKHDIALRLSAFDAFPNARWIFYVGRPTRSGESPKLVGPDGPETVRAASRGGCEGLVHVAAPMTKSTGGRRYDSVWQGSAKRCLSLPRTQVPAP